MKKRMMHISQWPLLLAIAVCAWHQPVRAQAGGDTLALFRDFIAVSNTYKQVPFYTGITIKNKSNLALQTSDTATTHAAFYIRSEGAYVRFGEFEQVVGDSMALLVSDQLQQMILYRDVAPVITRMRQMMGLTLPDSSLAGWARRYTARAAALPGRSAAIVLQSRQQIPRTGLPVESITVQYDPATRFPQQVTTVKRSLALLDSLQHAALSGRPELAGKLLAEEGRYFVVREEEQVFVYTTIEAPTSRTLPVLLTDRLEQTAEGEYKPVKKYEGYRLSQH